MTSIRAEGLGKAYKIFARPVDSLKELLFRRQYHEPFWALQDVSFSLAQGGSLGVIGENGAGKSTLLKLLAGTMQATQGTLERSGRVSGILELGSGFHPDLTGVENVRIGCAVLGLSPAETEERIPEIVDFSELGEFVYRPVKTYSSGMYMRLAFSVVTSVDPDILIVDEALSVGDQHFRKKCMDRIVSFGEQGKTLVFCSHFMYMITQVCDQCLWLRNGRTEMLGPTFEVTESYEDYERSLDGEEQPVTEVPETVAPKPDRGANRLLEVTLGGDVRDSVIETGGTLTITVRARVSPAIGDGVQLGVGIIRNDQVVCYGVSTQMEQQAVYSLGDSTYGIVFVVDTLTLLSGEYDLNVVLLDHNGMIAYDHWKGVSPFRVRHGTQEVGVARLVHRWERP